CHARSTWQWPPAAPHRRQRRTTSLCCASPLRDTDPRSPARPPGNASASPSALPEKSPSTPAAAPLPHGPPARYRPRSTALLHLTAALPSSAAGSVPAPSAVPRSWPTRSPAPHVPARRLYRRTPLRNTPRSPRAHSILQPRTTTLPRSADTPASRLQSPAPASSTLPAHAAPQTGCWQNRYAGSASRHAATAPASRAASAAAPSSLPRFPRRSRSARYSTSPTRSHRTASLSSVLQRPCSNLLSRSDLLMTSPFHAPRYS